MFVVVADRKVMSPLRTYLLHPWGPVLNLAHGNAPKLSIGQVIGFIGGLRLEQQNGRGESGSYWQAF